MNDFSKNNTKVEDEYNDFRGKVIHENRFLTDHPFLKRLHNHIGMNLITIREGMNFYRARQYSGETETSLYESFMSRNTDYEFPENPLLAQALNEIGKHYHKAVEWEHEHNFHGFPSGECLSPPLGMQNQGRLNPKYVPMLYAADDAYTAIKEIRPSIGDRVSLATLRLKRNITIVSLDFTGLFNLGDEIMSGPLYSLFTDSQSSEKDYVVSQAVTAFIRATQIAGEKVDGILYLSSQNAGGNNYCFFTDYDFEPNSSQVYLIQDTLLICEPQTKDFVDIVDSLEESKRRLNYFLHQ